jgi:hypothetical protein
MTDLFLQVTGAIPPGKLFKFLRLLVAGNIAPAPDLYLRTANPFMASPVEKIFVDAVHNIHHFSVTAFYNRGKGSHFMFNAGCLYDGDGFIYPIVGMPVLHNGQNLYRGIYNILVHLIGSNGRNINDGFGIDRTVHMRKSIGR